MTDVGQGEGIQVLRYDVSQYLYDVLLPVGFSNKDTCYWLVLGPLRTVLTFIIAFRKLSVTTHIMITSAMRMPMRTAGTGVVDLMLSVPHGDSPHFLTPRWLGPSHTGLSLA